MADQFTTVAEHRVRYAETDRQAVVFYGAYFTWQDEAVNATLREIDYDTDRLDEAGWDVSVVHADLDYRSPARYGDVVASDIRVDDVGESSITWSYRARRVEAGPDARRAGDEGAKLLAEGDAVHVAIDEAGEVRSVPAEFREALSRLGEETPE